MRCRVGGSQSANYASTRSRTSPAQIISGHNRRLAAERAGLAAVPCWVREMDDATAYMELVRANAQGELTVLERGMHALGFVEKGKHGRSAEAYAKETGREKEVRSVRREIDAAEVVHEIGHMADLSDRFHQLVEIHSSPRWLWPALVSRMVADEMTVDATRKMVAGVKDAPEPPG